MLRRLFIFILLAAGLWLIVFGVQRWLDHRAATSVATAFIEALRDGDREAALALLSPEQREAVEEKTGDKDSPFWAANPGMTYRIHHAELDGDTATVQLWIDKRGFVLEPILHLRRGETVSWKIVRIENLHVDPKWLDLQETRARLEGEATSAELSEALKGRPGVTVDRTALPDRDQ